MSKHKFLVAALVAGNLALFTVTGTLVAGGGSGSGGGFCADADLEECRCTADVPQESRQCLTEGNFGEFCGGTKPTPQFFCMGFEN